MSTHDAVPVRSVTGYIELEGGEKVAFNIDATGRWSQWGSSKDVLESTAEAVRGMAESLWMSNFISVRVLPGREKGE
jgi:hypothetical protein